MIANRQEVASRSRAAILVAAETLFAERGFSDTRLEDVGRVVGLGRSAILYHFPDKEILYTAVIGAVFSDLRSRVDVVLRKKDDIGRQIQNVVDAWLDFVLDRPAVARIVLREAVNYVPVARGDLRRNSGELIEILAGLLAQALIKEHPSVQHRMALQIVSSVVGTTTFHIAGLPAFLPDGNFDPFDPGAIKALRLQVHGSVRGLVGRKPASRPSHRRRSGGRT